MGAAHLAIITLLRIAAFSSLRLILTFFALSDMPRGRARSIRGDASTGAEEARARRQERERRDELKHLVRSTPRGRGSAGELRLNLYSPRAPIY